MIFCRELCSITNREHWQGYIELKPRKRKYGYRQIQRMLGVKCHIEEAKKTAIHNIVYCLKDGEISHLYGNCADPKADRIMISKLKIPKLERYPPLQDAQNNEETQDSKEAQKALSIQETKLSQADA